MAAAKMEYPDPLKNITNILELFQGKSVSETTSGSTTIQRTDLTDAQVTDQIKSILGSTQGLASIASGEKLSGMYNTTSKQQAMNDLLAKITSEVTAKKAGTVTIKSPETKKAETPGTLSEGKGLQTLLGVGAASLLGPSFGRLKGKLGIPDPGEALADLIFGSSAAAATTPVVPAITAATAGTAATTAGTAATTSAMETAAATEGVGSLGSMLASAGPYAAAIAAALYLDQNTKDSRLTDIAQNVITNPIQGLTDHLSDLGNFATLGLFK